MKKYLLWLLGALGCVGLDRVVKYWTTQNIPLGDTKVIFENIFNLTHVRNTGAAWSLGANMPFMRWVFLALTVVVMVVIIWFIVVKRPKSGVLLASLMFVVGGALGNFFDRVFLQYVVDTFQFAFVNFPVFNIADMFLSSGAVLFIIYMIFIEPKEMDAMKEHGDGVES